MGTVVFIVLALLSSSPSPLLYSSRQRRRTPAGAGAGRHCPGVDLLPFIVFVVLAWRRRCRRVAVTLIMHIASSSSLPCWHGNIVIVTWPCMFMCILSDSSWSWLCSRCWSSASGSPRRSQSWVIHTGGGGGGGQQPMVEMVALLTSLVSRQDGCCRHTGGGSGRRCCPWLMGDCMNHKGTASCRESAGTPSPEIARQRLTLGTGMWANAPIVICCHRRL